MNLKRKVQVIALSSLLLTCTASAFADPTSDARKAITALYNHQATAIEHKDVTSAFSHLAPGYVGVDVKGNKTTGAVARQNLSSVMGAAKSIHASVTVMQFSLKKNTATATAKKNVNVVIIDPSSKKTMTLIGTNISKDTWTKTKTGWLETHSQGLSQKATMDGKPVPN